MLAPDKSLGLIFQSNLAGQIQRPPDFTYPGNILDYFSFIQSFNNVLIIGKNSTSMKRFLWLMELRWETKYKSSLHHRLLWQTMRKLLHCLNWIKHRSSVLNVRKLTL